MKKMIGWQEKRGNKYYQGVPLGQLKTVEGIFKMKKNAAEKLKELLKQAREDLDAAKKKKDAHALKVKSIGISNTYRNPATEKIAYIKAFRNHYNNYLTKLYKNKADRHGPKGVSAMTTRMINKKAPVGFSNHTSGIAVDFKTTEDGLGTLAPSSSHSAKWKKSWFYKWLSTNDTKYKFKKLRTEEWHWDYVG